MCNSENTLKIVKLYTIKEWIVRYTDYLNAAVFKKDSRCALRMGGGLPAYEGWEELAFPAGQRTRQRRKGAGPRQQTWRGRPFSHARGSPPCPQYPVEYGLSSFQCKASASCKSPFSNTTTLPCQRRKACSDDKHSYSSLNPNLI